jgi:hypothetical protein
MLFPGKLSLKWPAQAGQKIGRVRPRLRERVHGTPLVARWRSQLPVCLSAGWHRVTKRMNRCSSASFRALYGDESKKINKQGGGGFRELSNNSGDLGEVSGFPLGTCGPAHHLCTRPRCPSLFLSPKPPLTS